MDKEQQQEIYYIFWYHHKLWFITKSKTISSLNQSTQKVHTDCWPQYYPYIHKNVFSVSLIIRNFRISFSLSVGVHYRIYVRDSVIIQLVYCHVLYSWRYNRLMYILLHIQYMQFGHQKLWWLSVIYQETKLKWDMTIMIILEIKTEDKRSLYSVTSNAQMEHLISPGSAFLSSITCLDQCWPLLDQSSVSSKELL